MARETRPAMLMITSSPAIVQAAPWSAVNGFAGQAGAVPLPPYHRHASGATRRACARMGPYLGPTCQIISLELFCWRVARGWQWLAEVCKSMKTW
jgi:hypothetical protein